MGNVAASVRQRLLNLARSGNRPFAELLQYYAMERFLYRLSVSDHAQCFVLKGALMLRVWDAPMHRPTLDVDLLGITSREQERLVAQIQEIMLVQVKADGLVFDPSSVLFEPITEEAGYPGARIRFTGTLGVARVHLQIDIGFGDVVHPQPQLAVLPSLLDAPLPRLLCYSRESAIAEKFETLVKLGALNSRMKDFYDVWALSRQFDFDGVTLAEAIRLTFERRGTALPARVEAFSEGFIQAKQGQWTAFRKRLEPVDMPLAFGDVVAGVALFLAPIAADIQGKAKKPQTWIAPGPWMFQEKS